MGTWWGQPLQDRRADECTKVWTVPGTQWEAAPSPALPGKKGWLPRGLRVYWEPWKTEIGVITRFPLTPGGILIALRSGYTGFEFPRHSRGQFSPYSCLGGEIVEAQKS